MRNKRDWHLMSILIILAYVSLGLVLRVANFGPLYLPQTSYSPISPISPLPIPTNTPAPVGTVQSWSLLPFIGYQWRAVRGEQVFLTLVGEKGLKPKPTRNPH